MQQHPNAISPSAYDTAWLAWLEPRARDWLLEAQHPDGSWGAELEYYHDRVISTLSAINALAATSTNEHDLQRIERGIKYLEKATVCLSQDPTETAGFEMLAPTLVEIGQGLGLNLDRVAHALEPYEVTRRQKLALIPPEMVYNPISTAPHSLEFVGLDRVDHAAVTQIRFANGSIHNSPAATAFCEVAGVNSIAGQDCLSSVLDHYEGAAPNFTPFGLYEINWSLLHLQLAEDLSQFEGEIRPLVDKVRTGWGPEGVGITPDFPVDLDNTAVAYMLLSKLGEAPDPAVFATFEEKDHFRCYRFERNISLDVHVRLVMALRQLPYSARHDDMLLKAINILGRYLQDDFITDKWHVSPYYSTAHAVIALNGLADNLIRNQIYWLCHTQHADGRWTFYPHFPQAAVEETALALLALLVVQKRENSIPHQVIRRGMDYLMTHYSQQWDLPALWVAKAVYRPHHITRSILLATFSLYHQLY